MKLAVFKNVNSDELSMIEVAHAILEEKGEEMPFSEILKEVQNFLKLSDEETEEKSLRLYTQLNTDGSFLPLGGNVWVLRSWYAIDMINEETITLDELEDEGILIDEDKPLLGGEEDEEDMSIPVSTKSVDDILYDENTDDEAAEVAAYDAELAEVDVDAPLDDEDDAAVLVDDEDADDEDE